MSTEFEVLPANPWMKPVLRLAGVYNLSWGSWVVLFPQSSMKICGYPQTAVYPEFWQCIGMIVGVYGIGYWIAASDPFRHWPVILVGYLGKIFGPVGFLYGWLSGKLPLSAGIVNIFNDLIWLAPFTIILWRAFRFEQTRLTAGTKRSPQFEEAITQFRSQQGQTLLELSQDGPVLVVFLRHSGCTFCRQSLAEIEKHRSDIEDSGTQIALVHMDPDAEKSRQLFETYHVDDLPRFSDPEQVLYRAFAVEVAHFRQIMSFRILWQGFRSAILQRHGFSKIRGNVFRLPGAFLLDQGSIIQRYQPRDAADHPDFRQFVCAAENETTSRDSA